MAVESVGQLFSENASRKTTIAIEDRLFFVIGHKFKHADHTLIVAVIDTEH